MQPLGLGSGSGLGDRSVRRDKMASPRSGYTRVKAAAEPQDWGVNARNEKGRTALHYACGMASAGTASVLLDAGADVNARDRDGFTPLHLAAGHGRHLCVMLLLERGASVFARERAGRTPRELTVKVLDENIQAQEKLRDGSLQMKIAESSRGDFDLIIRLLTDAESKKVDVPASAAVEPRSIVKRGNVAKQMKALQSAALGNALTVACRGDVEFVKLLLSGGAPVDFRGSDGATPLLAAADGGFANCVQLLLEHGANPNARDNIGITALIAAAYNGHVECLRVLLNNGASINAISEGGVTPLIAAAEGRSGDCTEVLLQAGAEVNAKTDGGKTALIHAVSNNCIEAAEALLNGGAEINAADGEGYTALHYGARDNSAECIRILLERGADETRKCRLGQTPLQEAQKGSEGAKLLEDSWKKLELEIAMRAEELLNQDKLERKSSTAQKSSTRFAREKKNVKNKKKKKQQEAVEKADYANQELTKDDESFLAVDVVSPSGLEVSVHQASLNLDRDSSSDRSTHLVSGGSLEYQSDPPGISPKMAKQPINPSPFSAGEDAFENQDEWIRVDGKRAGAAGTSLKTSGSQPKPQGISITSGLPSPLRGSSKSGEVSPSADHLLTERKTLSGVQSNNPKILEEDDSKDGESSPWVQAVLGWTHSVGDGTSPSKTPLGRTDSGGEGTSPSKIPLGRTHSSGDGTSPSKTPLGRTHSVGDGTSPPETPPEARAGNATEDELIDRVEHIELELEQARQAEQAMMEKVKQLEILKEANLVQILELTQSLSRAHYQAETTKTEMQFRIYDLEAVVASQTQALEIAQAENAELKLQLRRSEFQATEQEPSKVGVAVSVSGMVRSASESSLHSMGCGTEPRSPLELLPFIPKAGPKTDTDNWFSLVPSPRPD